MKLKEWLDNPKTKNIPGYNMVKEQLRARFLDMLKKGKKFDIGVYQSSRNGLLVHVKVPTEGDIPELYYDVVLHIAGGMATLMESEVKVFSNCPSFTFRYAYVAFQSKELIPEFVDYYDDIVIKDKPDTTNPMEIMGYEKSIYYAILSLEYYGYKTYSDLNNDVRASREGLKEIMSATAKVQEAQVKKSKYSKEKRLEKERAKALMNKQSTDPVKTKTTAKTSSSLSRPNHRVEAKKKIGASHGPKSKIGAKRKK